MIWLSRKTLKLFVMLFLGSSLLSTVGFLYPTIFTAGHMQLSVTEQQSLFSRIWNLSFLLRQMSFLSLLPQVRPGNLSLLYYSTNFPEPDELTCYTVVFFRLAVCLSYLYDLTEDIYVPGVNVREKFATNLLEYPLQFLCDDLCKCPSDRRTRCFFPSQSSRTNSGKLFFSLHWSISAEQCSVCWQDTD